MAEVAADDHPGVNSPHTGGLKCVPHGAVYDFTEHVVDFYRTNVPALRSGAITAREYCERIQLLAAEAAKLVAFSTRSFSEYRRIAFTHCARLQESELQHELAHARVAASFGLPVHFQFILTRSKIFSSLYHGYQLLVEDDIGHAALDWPAEKLLAYTEAMSGAPGDDMSMGDRAMQA